MRIDLTQEDNTDNAKLSKAIDEAYLARKNKNAYTTIFEQYRDPATRYSFPILEGDVVAGVDMKLSAFRHLQDLTLSSLVTTKSPSIRMTAKLLPLPLPESKKESE